MASRGRKALLERQDNKARLDRRGHKDHKGLPVGMAVTAKMELLDRKAHKAHKVRKGLPERLALTVRTA
jgi:hypothetical protein